MYDNNINNNYDDSSNNQARDSNHSNDNDSDTMMLIIFDVIIIIIPQLSTDTRDLTLTYYRGQQIILKFKVGHMSYKKQ